MELSPPRGMLDLLPPEGGRMRALYDRAAEVARRYGYRYVETPTLEHTELFAQTAGATSDVVTKEMYTFTDRGGRSLTLRPEGTAPVLRAYLPRVQQLGTPFKAYYLTRMYRYGRPQAGRYREHRQFGVEVFGVEGPEPDVEVIALGNRFLTELGLSRFKIQVNSIGDGQCRPAYREVLLAFLRGNRDLLRDEHRDRFEQNPLRVLDCKDDACRAVAEQAPRITDHLCEACREHFDAVLVGLRHSDMRPVVTPSLVRGLDYYTRTAFEFVSDVLSEQQGTLFGGGRYDGLAEAMDGQHVPGVGFGMGLERVLLALQDEGIEPPQEPGLDVFVVPVDRVGRDNSYQLLRQLRALGVSAAWALDDRPLKAQLRMADRSGARFALLVGEREVADGAVTVRRLSDGHQHAVPLTDVAAWFAQQGRGHA